MKIPRDFRKDHMIGTEIEEIKQQAIELNFKLKELCVYRSYKSKDQKREDQPLSFTKMCLQLDFVVQTEGKEE